MSPSPSRQCPHQAPPQLAWQQPPCPFFSPPPSLQEQGTQQQQNQGGFPRKLQPHRPSQPPRLPVWQRSLEAPGPSAAAASPRPHRHPPGRCLGRPLLLPWHPPLLLLHQWPHATRGPWHCCCYCCCQSQRRVPAPLLAPPTHRRPTRLRQLGRQQGQPGGLWPVAAAAAAGAAPRCWSGPQTTASPRRAARPGRRLPPHPPVPRPAAAGAAPPLSCHWVAGGSSGQIRPSPERR